MGAPGDHGAVPRTLTGTRCASGTDQCVAGLQAVRCEIGAGERGGRGLVRTDGGVDGRRPAVGLRACLQGRPQFAGRRQDVLCKWVGSWRATSTLQVCQHRGGPRRPRRSAPAPSNLWTNGRATTAVRSVPTALVCGYAWPGTTSAWRMAQCARCGGRRRLVRLRCGRHCRGHQRRSRRAPRTTVSSTESWSRPGGGSTG